MTTQTLIPDPAAADVSNTDRRLSLGASDAAAAVGLSRWVTRLGLYLQKIGEADGPSENEPMRWGTLLEPVVRQEYANRTGNTIIVPQKRLQHPDHDWLTATPDGLVMDRRRYYEGKTARTAEGWGEPGSDEIPQEYLLQVQHGMFVTGFPVADVAVLIGGQDFRIYVVEANTELQTMLVDQEADFWAHVVSRQPPAPVSREDVKRRWKVSSGASVNATAECQDALAVLANVKASVKWAEDWLDSATAAVQGYMRDAAELVSADGDVLATWKNVKSSPRFDLEQFKAEHPDLWKQYLRDPSPQRRFLLKVKGEPCQQLPSIPPAPLLETAKAQ